MDLTDIGRGSNTYSTSTWTVTLPATSPSGRASAANDLMFVFLAIDGSSTPTTPTGWTRIVNQTTSLERWSIYRRVRVSGDTDPAFVFGGATSGSALVLNVPANGLASIVSTSAAGISGTPDPNPVSFTDTVGGLRLFAVVAQEDVTQSGTSNWGLLAEETPAGLPGHGVWGHLGVGPVDTFNVSTPGASDPFFTLTTDITFDLGDGNPWTVGRVAWGTRGAWH